LLSTAVALIYFPTRSVKASFLLMSLTAFAVVCIIDDSYSDWSLNVVLDCISFMVKDVEHFSVCLLAVVLLLRIVCSVHLPIFSVGCWFFERLVVWVPFIFWLLMPS
jgi:hypothetical protein